MIPKYFTIEIKHMKYIHRLHALKHTELFKYNNIAYHIGLGVRTVDENIVRSPYLKLKDMIMGQTDFVKKQHDILKFYERFSNELIEAFNNQGKTIKKKIDIHRQAEANKAYAHFKWT